MRLNIFVGLDGTNALLKDTLDNNLNINRFIGSLARTLVSRSFDEIFNLMFNKTYTESESGEYVLTISRTGAANTLLSTLLEKCPVGTRVWFFKSINDEISIELYKKFVRSGENLSTNRGTRVTGLTDEQLNDDTLVSQSAINGLQILDSKATDLSASNWSNFDMSVFYGGPLPETSPILTRLFVKS